MTPAEQQVTEAYRSFRSALFTWRSEARNADPAEFERRDGLVMKVDLAVMAVTGPVGDFHRSNSQDDA